jgi:hypothetical protein
MVDYSGLVWDEPAIKQEEWARTCCIETFFATFHSTAAALMISFKFIALNGCADSNDCLESIVNL